MHQNLRIISLVLLLTSALFFGACSDSGICSPGHPAGPMIVTLSCAAEAQTDGLAEEPLIVEISTEGGDWMPCERRRDDENSDVLSTQPICDAAAPATVRYECGEDVIGTIALRASQNGRIAGPVEITTSVDTECFNPDDARKFFYDLVLDLVE